MKYGTGQYAPITQTAEKTDDSERLVPRYDEVIDGSALKLWIALGSGRWDDLRENQRGPWREGARAVLEAAGVERLRAELERVTAELTRKDLTIGLERARWKALYDAHGVPHDVDLEEAKQRISNLYAKNNWRAEELERTRQHNAALTSKLEGEKRVNELLRFRVGELEAELSECKKVRDQHSKDRERHYLEWHTAHRAAEENARLHQEAAKALDEQKARADEVTCILARYNLATISELAEYPSELTRKRDETQVRAEVAERVAREQKARADRAEGQRNWAADRIAALEKAVRSAANLLDGTDAVTLYPTGFVACAFNELRAALDSAQPAPEPFRVEHRSTDESLVHMTRSPTQYTEPFRSMAAEILNYRRGSAQPAPDASEGPETVGDRLRLIRQLNERDERIRELEERNKSLDESLKEWINAAAVWGFGRVSQEPVPWRLSEAIKTTMEREAELQKNFFAAEERIRVACAELRVENKLLNEPGLDRIATALEGKDSGQPAAATTADPKGAGESQAETAPAGCSSTTHPTPWRVGSKVGRNVYDANDAPVVMMPDEQTAERVVAAMNGEESRRAWVSETHAKLEAAANLRMLCMLAAQYETTVMARDFRSGGGLTVALNNPSTKYNGPDYARGLVERTRARLEETR